MILGEGGQRTRNLARESLGFAVDAADGIPGAVDLLFTALESGAILARAASTPPLTGIAVFDAAGCPTPEWWRDFKDAGVGPTKWAEWLRLNMELEQLPIATLLTAQFESQRKNARLHRYKGLSERVWSDIEALAWFASQDLVLVAKMRDFAFQPPNIADRARSIGLRYLRLCVARDHCHCASQKPLRHIGAANACTCLPTAWLLLQSALIGGQIRGTVGADDQQSLPIDTGEYLNGILRYSGHRIEWRPAARRSGLTFDRDNVFAVTTEKQPEGASKQIELHVRKAAGKYKGGDDDLDEVFRNDADKMKEQTGLDGRQIADLLRKRPEFQKMSAEYARTLVKGRYKQGSGSLKSES